MFAKQSLSKIVSQSGSLRQQAIRCAVTQKAIMGFLPAVACRQFSTENIADGARKLNHALEKEIKYENENYVQEEDLDLFLKDSGFAFKEEDDGIFMSLSKQVGNKVIEVTFEARQPIPEDQQLSDEEGQGEEDDMGPETENYCDFTIFITEAGTKRGMVIEGTTVDTEINYNSVLVSNDVSEQKSLHRLERQIKQYAGPDFSTLDERIQTALTEYLEGFGVNERLGAFVECMSLDKDQRLYMSWLSSLKNFVSDDAGSK